MWYLRQFLVIFLINEKTFGLSDILTREIKQEKVPTFFYASLSPNVSFTPLVRFQLLLSVTYCSMVCIMHVLFLWLTFILKQVCIKKYRISAPKSDNRSDNGLLFKRTDGQSNL